MSVCESCKKEIVDRVSPTKEEGLSNEWPMKCATCGKDSTVPFKPRDNWPTYCRGCYAERKR